MIQLFSGIDGVIVASEHHSPNEPAIRQLLEYVIFAVH